MKQHKCRVCEDGLDNPSEIFSINNFAVNEILRELKKDNPYPQDVFPSMEGKAAFHAYNLALFDVKRRIEEIK